jgi:hypothetical protein
VVTWPLAPDPPCEQVLAAVGVGCWALASPILRHRPVPCPPSSWPSRTRRPPYEQLLIGVARGSYAWGCRLLFSPVLVSSSSNRHPQSTLRAVARRHGGGCRSVLCAVCRRRPCFSGGVSDMAGLWVGIGTHLTGIPLQRSPGTPA